MINEHQSLPPSEGNEIIEGEEELRSNMSIRSLLIQPHDFDFNNENLESLAQTQGGLLNSNFSLNEMNNTGQFNNEVNNSNRNPNFNFSGIQNSRELNNLNDENLIRERNSIDNNNRNLLQLDQYDSPIIGSLSPLPSRETVASPSMISITELDTIREQNHPSRIQSNHNGNIINNSSSTMIYSPNQREDNVLSQTLSRLIVPSNNNSEVRNSNLTSSINQPSTLNLNRNASLFQANNNIANNNSNNTVNVNNQQPTTILGGFLASRLPSISPVNNLEAVMEQSPLESPIEQELTSPAPSSISPGLRRLRNSNLEALSRRYFRQVMYGCNKQNCTTRYCAGNKNFIPRDIGEATALSMTLSHHGEAYLCPDVTEIDTPEPTTLPIPLQKGMRTELAREWKKRTKNLLALPSEDTLERYPVVDFEYIRTTNERCKVTKCYDTFAQLMYNIYSHADKLANCFPQIEPELYQNCPVDIEEVRKSHNYIMKQCPKIISSSILKGISTLFEKIKLGVEVLREKNLIIIIIVLMNSNITNTLGNSEVIPKLCDILINLPEKYINLLSKFIGSKRFLNHDPEDEQLIILDSFHQILDVFHGFIYNRLVKKNGIHISPNKDEYTMKATMCLGILYRINEEHNISDYNEFYNKAINELIEIKEDYPNFRSRNGFSYCNYPFVLNPATKSDILKVESMFQMRQELQDSFFRALFVGVNSPYLVLEIRRDHIIRDALVQLSNKTTQELKKQLRVTFIGEEGIDEGGVQKEFFQLLVREMMDPNYGMFIEREDTRLYWFHPNPNEDEIGLEELKLIGRLIGLAIYNSVILDLHFPLALYKKLLNKPIELEDLDEYDHQLTAGLLNLLNFDGDVESAFGWTFQIEYEAVGTRFQYDLKPNGNEIILTNENRQEFVDLYVDFLLNKSIEKQFNAFKEGFEHVCANSTIQLFRAEELEQIICGSTFIDFVALESVTHYDGGYTRETPVIQYFWEIVHQFSNEDKKRLLFFTTGSDRVPPGGLARLQFVIAKNGGDSDRLPTAHTCFNVLLLCEYSSKEKLKERLLTAMDNSEGFGMI